MHGVFEGKSTRRQGSKGRGGKMGRNFITFEGLEARRFLSVAPLGGTGAAVHSAAGVAVSAGVTPTEGGITLSKTAGQHFTARRGEVTVKVIDLALNAVIDWGDGTKSDGKMI